MEPWKRQWQPHHWLCHPGQDTLHRGLAGCGHRYYILSMKDRVRFWYEDRTQVQQAFLNNSTIKKKMLIHWNENSCPTLKLECRALYRVFKIGFKSIKIWLRKKKVMGEQNALLASPFNKIYRKYIHQLLYYKHTYVYLLTHAIIQSCAAQCIQSFRYIVVGPDGLLQVFTKLLISLDFCFWDFHS